MFVGLDGTSREIREKRLGIRRYDRQASRNIHSQPLCHERFDGFVFERMIGLHHQSSPDMQSVRGLRQCGGELVQFAVDFNAQRLEDAFGGIARRAVGLRHHFIDQTVELCGGGKRLLVSTRHDGAGDLTRETLFTVFLEYADQFRRSLGGKNPFGRQRLADVHAHIQRRIMRIGEATIGFVDLQAG